MRVISGQAKGRKLKLVHGKGTRPIMDRVKENLFNLIQWDVPGSRFLDLFGGTGSVGIEALSRGAAEAVFVDSGRDAIATIHANLAHCRLDHLAAVIRTDAFSFLGNTPREPFDIIYIAPPQYVEMWSKALLLLDQRPDWLTPKGIVAVQIHPREHQDLPLVNLEQYDRRKYGSTLLCFYQRVAEEE